MTSVRHQQKGAFVQGVITEALNPKTAFFLLVFTPHVNPAGPMFVQFVLLGFITTLLTSGALTGLGVYVAVDR